MRNKVENLKVLNKLNLKHWNCLTFLIQISPKWRILRTLSYHTTIPINTNKIKQHYFVITILVVSQLKLLVSGFPKCVLPFLHLKSWRGYSKLLKYSWIVQKFNIFLHFGNLIRRTIHSWLVTKCWKSKTIYQFIP